VPRWCVGWAGGGLGAVGLGLGPPDLTRQPPLQVLALFWGWAAAAPAGRTSGLCCFHLAVGPSCSSALRWRLAGSAGGRQALGHSNSGVGVVARWRSYGKIHWTARP